MAESDYIVGGLLAGFGKGLVEDARQSGLEKRERALSQLQQKQRLELEGVRGEREEKRDTRRYENEANRDEARHGNRLDELETGSNLRTKERTGLLSNTERFVDKSGKQWERTREGVKPLLGPSGEQLTGIPKGAKTTDTGEGLTASEKRTLDAAIKKYTNQDTHKIDYEAVTAHLRSTGQGRLAEFISGGEGSITYSQAVERATKEAEERTGFFTSRSSEFPETKGSKEEWISKRAREIMGGGGAAARPAPAPKTGGGVTVPIEQPKPAARSPKPAKYPDARWSDKVGAWVVQKDGKFYKVKE